MIEKPTCLTDQLQNLSERLAIEMRALNRTKVSTVNGVVPDNSGAVTIDSVTSATKDASGNVITSTYATKSELNSGLNGRVKSVNGVQADSNGNVSITSVDSATKASQDGNGNNIRSTYVTKTDAAASYLPIDGKASSATVADSANSVAWGNVSGKPSSFTPSSHDQASSTINALTGYSKPSSTSALTTSDTLNSALGKLERGLDGKLNASATAAKATADASGNNIAETYATKTELSGKANSSHSHAISDVTNLQTSLDAKLATATYNTDKATFATKSELSGKLDASANATSASKWATARTITLGGDASGSVSIDGSENKTLTVTIVDDSHNHVISNVDGLQSALDGKASTGSVETALSTAKSYTDTKVAELVDSAPTTLDTLGELATALQENESVTDALNTAIGTKANASEVVKLSGNQTIAGTKTFSSTISGSISGNAATATKATQDASGNVITSTYATKSELTSGLSGKVQSVNGVKPDSSGNVSIAVGSDYTLPTASANTLGGVKIGSNITNNSGTISVSQKNVTDALGYTPLQNAPVTSVDGKTGAIDLSSTYQPKGNYLTSAPVSSVNGQTGAVTIDTGVTSFNGFKGAVTYTAPVTSVNGKTGAVNIDVGVKTVNGTAPDSSGNVTIEVSGGGGSGDGIPKTGNRGTLAGYESFDSGIDWEGVMDGSSMPPTITINDNSPDVSFAAMDVIVENGSGNRFMDFMVEVSLGLDVGAPPLSHSTAWTKCVFLMGGCIVEFGDNWVWADNTVPDLGDGGLLVLHWNTDFGIASFVNMSNGMEEIMMKKIYDMMG